MAAVRARVSGATAARIGVVAAAVAMVAKAEAVQDAFAEGATVVAEHHSLLLFLTVAVAGACMAACVFFAVGNPLKRRHPKAPPTFSTGLPVVGNMAAFAKHPLAAVEAGLKAKGPAFTMRLMGKDCTFLLGPEAHAEFFRAKDSEADQAPPYLFMTPVFGKGVVYDAPQKVRFQQLKFAAHGLKAKALAGYVPEIVRECEAFFATWPASGEVDLLEEFSRLIILTASRSLMGPEIRENLFEAVANLFADLDKGITPLSIFWPNAPIPQHWKRNKARKAMVAIFTSVLHKRRESGEKHDDILQVLMDAEYKGAGPLPDEHIAGILIALLFAGQHTSSITTTWTAIHLINDKPLLARVMAEQAAVLGTPAGKLDFENIGQMDLLYHCMKETTRLHPPLIYVMREALVDLPILGGKYVVPKGHTMFASPAISMSMPEAFSNPKAYDPDRFMPPRNEGGSFAYVGFGAGMHGCQGEAFAYTQIRAILSVLLRKFELEPVVPGIPEPNFAAMVVPPSTTHTRVRFTRRKE
mmetsp:Transcript_4971/g.17988  ORF Transcript_4971/g.17988 Transcript_4971/m.17988 type:complete len:526 (-) Transcript_4971:180-1757(-)